MRRLSFCVGFACLVVSLSAAADDIVRPDIGVSYGYQGLAFRKALSENTLMYLGANIGRMRFESHPAYAAAPNDISTNSYSILAGARYYLSHAKLSDFVQVELSSSYSNTPSASSSPTTRNWGTTLAYGLEYYLDPHLSIEARAGLGFGYSKSSYSQGSSTNRSVSIPAVGTAITYYW